MVDSLFQFREMNSRGIARAKDIAQAFDDLLGRLEILCNEDKRNSREFMITKTKLEEACFFAKKSMAMRTENQAQKVP